MRAALNSLKQRVNAARIRWRGHIESLIGGFPVKAHPADSWFWIDTYFGAWEPETLKIFRKHIRPGMEYCEIGAWVGPTAIFAQKLGAHVICFEPDPVAYERLLFNIRLNAPGAITSFHLALGAADGLRRIGAMAACLGQSGSSLHAPERHDQSANVLTLSWDSAVRLLQLPRFDFIKIDIEGGESELLPAMMPYLTKYRPAIYLSTHYRFIPENQRGEFLLSLEDLWKLYPLSPKLDENAVKSGFPAFLLSDCGG